jgi:hypothetical protein
MSCLGKLGFGVKSDYKELKRFLVLFCYGNE